MNKIIFLMVTICLTTAAPVMAAPEGQKGASASAYEHASDNSIFNRTSDWFATVGKSQEEKDRIKAERQARRAAKRVEKESEKAKGEAENKMDESKDKAAKLKEQNREREREMKRKMNEGNDQVEKLKERSREQERDMNRAMDQRMPGAGMGQGRGRR